MFIKRAKVPIIAVAEANFDDTSKKLAFKVTVGDKTASHYKANSGRIDVASMLKLVAESYDISDNPQDYIYEAARAVTASVPNENGDEFGRDELLRFDHRLGKAVYQTFILKPHHINHRADNPKTARGVVLDASYNNMAPPLEKCPSCGTRTAELTGRDESGINCIKCGTAVKDEFVELLLAIDTKKDPTFADGVKSGSLDSLSMGCEASYTDCSICDNRARSTSEFCQHIKSGNKKKMFKTASGMRMSFEKCGGVVFTEISRVDQPADPTAKQRELLQVPMSTESELLIMSTKIAKLEHLARVAQAQMPMQPPTAKPPAPKQPNQSYDGDPAKAPPGDPNGLHDAPAGEQVTDPTRHQTMDSLRALIQELGQAVSLEPNAETQKQLSVWQKALSLLEDMDRADEQQHGGPSSDGPAPQIPVPEKPEPPPAPDQPNQQAHLAQVDESAPQTPFKTLAESIKWAESSVYKLKAENHRLTAEREARSRDASTSGRPFLAWENASFNAQIKANSQYIDRLGSYIVKARELEASGAPWGKDLTRSMSRFFATKVAQETMDNIMQELEELAPANPEMVEMIKVLLVPDGGVAGDSDLNDYLQKREESEDQHVTNEEMGIRPEESGGKLPSTMASKVIEQSIAADLNNIMGLVKETQVGTSKELKFAGIYKDVKVSVTKVGNVRVSTSKGNLFVVRPSEKPKDVVAATKIAREILSHIAEYGLTETVLKYDAIVGPKMAQVLEDHIEDFAGGREDGDKGPITDDHESDMDFKKDKPKDSLVDEEHTDRADEEREQRDQSNSDVLEEHQPDHKEKLKNSSDSIVSDDTSDMADKREKPAKNTQKDLVVDYKDKKPKKSAEWEKPWLKDKKDGDESKDKKENSGKTEKEAQMAPPAGPPPSGAPGAPATPGAAGPGPQMACMAGAMCADEMCPEHGKMAQGTPPSAPMGDASGTGGPSGMPIMSTITDPIAKAAAQQHTTRVERLYKSRLDKATSAHAKKLAEVETVAVNKALSKLARALKLAAKRQELNIEYSPLKAAMHDVLASEQDIDADSFYPGMDDFTASKLVENTATNAFTEFTDSLLKRASEFLKMSDEALMAIEADVKNLQPAPIQVQASVGVKPEAKTTLRQAAVNGNFSLAPASVDETISSGGNRDNIRSALNTTKVQRTSAALLKK